MSSAASTPERQKHRCEYSDDEETERDPYGAPDTLSIWAEKQTPSMPEKLGDYPLDPQPTAEMYGGMPCPVI